MTTEDKAKAKKELIKKLKAKANAAISKVYSLTFDQNERNTRFIQIQTMLENSIKEVEAL